MRTFSQDHLKGNFYIEHFSRFVWVGGVFSVVLFVFFTMGKLPILLHPPKEPLTPNAFGDSYGYINAFFSALAFAGVVVTLVLQMVEMKAQRDEMVEMQRTQMLHSRFEYLMSLSSPSDVHKAEMEALSEFIRSHVLRYTIDNGIESLSGVTQRIGEELDKVASLLRNGCKESNKADLDAAISKVRVVRMQVPFHVQRKWKDKREGEIVELVGTFLTDLEYACSVFPWRINSVRDRDDLQHLWDHVVLHELSHVRSHLRFGILSFRYNKIIETLTLSSKALSICVETARRTNNWT